MKLELSPLGHTWILDLDGTVLKHNGHKLDGQDSLLEGAQEFFANIPENDTILFVTSRIEAEKQATEAFLQENHIPFHQIVYGLPYGERILINDQKPSGLHTAIALNPKRDECVDLDVKIREDL